MTVQESNFKEGYSFKAAKTNTAAAQDDQKIEEPEAKVSTAAMVNQSTGINTNERKRKTNRKTKVVVTKASVRQISSKRIKKQKSRPKEKPTGNFTCEYCNMTFSKSVSLGGHISKAHAGQSKRFSDKMKVYMRRQPDRENLTKAKDWFKQTTGLDPRSFRILITSIKKDFMAGREPKIPENIPRINTDRGN